MKALSIRQPWAWLIVNGHKDVENRTWFSGFSGPLLIHAGKAMTRQEYSDCWTFARRVRPDLQLPGMAALERGGFVGLADMTTCTTRSESPWFVGPYGFKLAAPRAMPFLPAKGALGFFEATL